MSQQLEHMPWTKNQGIQEPRNTNIPKWHQVTKQNGRLKFVSNSCYRICYTRTSHSITDKSVTGHLYRGTSYAYIILPMWPRNFLTNHFRCNVENWPDWKMTRSVIFHRWKVTPRSLCNCWNIPGGHFLTVWSHFSTLKFYLFIIHKGSIGQY